jgi:hypothetical protein
MPVPPVLAHGGGEPSAHITVPVGASVGTELPPLPPVLPPAPPVVVPPLPELPPVVEPALPPELVPPVTPVSFVPASLLADESSSLEQAAPKSAATMSASFRPQKVV